MKRINSNKPHIKNSKTFSNSIADSDFHSVFIDDFKTYGKNQFTEIYFNNSRIIFCHLLNGFDEYSNE